MVVQLQGLEAHSDEENMSAAADQQACLRRSIIHSCPGLWFMSCNTLCFFSPPSVWGCQILNSTLLLARCTPWSSLEFPTSKCPCLSAQPQSLPRVPNPKCPRSAPAPKFAWSAEPQSLPRVVCSTQSLPGVWSPRSAQSLPGVPNPRFSLQRPTQSLPGVEP